MSITNYNCGQQELYVAARTGWNGCFANLSSFSAFKTKYTAAFIEERLQEINAAELLPDMEQREEDSRTLRIELKNKAIEGMNNWQTLKRYIFDAFPSGEREIKLNAAGQSYYRKAGKDDWIAIKRLLHDGNIFITDNKQALQAEGSMPPAFPTLFVAAKDSFDELHQQFISASQNNNVETQAKIMANNEVYAKLISMFLDGQDIYRSDEAIRKKFTFDQLLLLIAGPGTQGFRGIITQTNDQPVISGDVSFTGATNKTVAIDTKGHYECSQLAAGTDYTVTVSIPGCETKTITGIVVEKGIMKILNIEAETIIS